MSKPRVLIATPFTPAVEKKAAEIFDATFSKYILAPDEIVHLATKLQPAAVMVYPGDGRRKPDRHLARVAGHERAVSLDDRPIVIGRSVFVRCPVLQRNLGKVRAIGVAGNRVDHGPPTVGRRDEVGQRSVGPA